MHATATSVLTSKRIPDSCPEIEEVRAARVVTVYRVGAPQRVHREGQRGRHRRPAEAQTGSGFRKIGPVFAFRIYGEITVPVDLRFEAAQKLNRPQRVAGPVLRVHDKVVFEPADVDTVGVGFKE